MADLAQALQPQPQAPQQPQVQQDPQQQIQAQQAGIGAPKSDEEYQQRKGGWTNFFNDLKNDPETLATMMVMGYQFMQPGSTGQRFSEGMMQGMSYQMALRNAQRAIDEERRKAGIEERQMQVSEGQLNVQRRRLGQENRQHQDRMGIEWAKLGLSKEELASLDAYRRAQGKNWDAQVSRWASETARDHGEAVMNAALKDYAKQVEIASNIFTSENAPKPDWDLAVERAIKLGQDLWGEGAPGASYLASRREGESARATGGQPTWEDIDHTARKHNMTREEVLKRLQLTPDQIAKAPGTRG